VLYGTLWILLIAFLTSICRRPISNLAAAFATIHPESKRQPHSGATGCTVALRSRHLAAHRRDRDLVLHLHRRDARIVAAIVCSSRNKSASVLITISRKRRPRRDFGAGDRDAVITFACARGEPDPDVRRQRHARLRKLVSLLVIASETKQSILFFVRRDGLFASARNESESSSAHPIRLTAPSIAPATQRRRLVDDILSLAIHERSSDRSPANVDDVAVIAESWVIFLCLSEIVQRHSKLTSRRSA